MSEKKEKSNNNNHDHPKPVKTGDLFKAPPKEKKDKANKAPKGSVVPTADDIKLFKSQFPSLKALVKDNVKEMEAAIQAIFKPHKNTVYHVLGFKGSRSETTFISTPLGTMAIMEMAYMKLNQQ